MMTGRKPLYEHDTEVYDMVSLINNVLREGNVEYKLEYDNLMVTYEFDGNDGLSHFEIVILDWSDDDNESDDMLPNMYDSPITVELYRNEQIIGKFNGAFEYIITASINAIISHIK